jgi:hypothetical protein
MKLRLLSLIAWALAWVTPSVQAQTFTLAGSNPMPTLQFGGRIFFIDVDTDGDQDLLSQNGSTVGTGIELRINNGNGTFAAPIAAAAPSGTFSSGPLNGISFSAVTTFSTVSLFAVDVDDDGHTDIVEATSAAAGRWIRNNGNGTFTSQASPFPTLPFSPRMLFGDWNGDGAIDLLYQSGSTAGTDIAMMLNNGNGTFASAITAAAPSGTFSSGPFSGISFTAITVASTTSFWWLDYDKDGDRDLVEQISSIAGRVIRNNGGGSWSVVATPFPTLSFASRMIFGDFESDGDLDILYQNGNTSGTGWNVQLNNGNGTYAAAISAPATGTFASGPFSGHTFTQYPSPANIYMLDLDKDGDHDLIEQVNNVAGPLRLQNGSPPVLASTIPADNATGVAVNSNITLTFDRSVTKGTGNILIRQTNVGNTLFESIPVTSGLVTGSGTTWVINPTSNLATTTAYSITIDAGAFVDGSSKALHEVSGKLTLNFTSGAALSNNADLSALALTTATINEAFAAATTAYTSNVANATSSVTVTPTAAQANATIEARVGANAFASVTSGSPSASLALAVGPNTIDVRVTAQDGTTIKTYTVTVTRAAPPVAIATNDLMVIAYNSSEDVPVDSIALLATADIPNGTTIFLTDRGWQTSTTSLRPTSLLENTVTWVTSGVTAGKIIRIATGTPNSTTISVSDVVASFIGTSYGSLSGSLDPDLTAGDQMLIYTTADNNKDSTPTFIHAFNADAPRLFNTLNDDTPLDGWSDSDTSNLNNTSKLPPGLTAVLTTGDGGSGFGIANYVNSGTDEFDNYIYNGPTSQTTRALWITRITTFANWLGRDTTTYDTQTAGALTPTNFLIGSLSSNADLASLSTTAGSITFSAATTAYALNVPNGTTTTTVTATRAEANATLEVRVNSGSYAPLTSGVASGNLALTVGANPIDVRVTAQDGTTQKTYTITVTRAPIPPNLSINDVTLSEGNTGSTTFAFTVSLSAPAPVGGVSFNIATANGTATQPGDYTLNSQAAQTIPAASSTYSFNVSVIGDTDVETNETFFVNVTSVSGAVVTDGQGLGTITNDDVATPPSITSVSPARGPIAGGTTVVITGTGFTGATAVNFGSTPATSYTVNSPTQITATLPAGTGGIFDISVTAGTGTGTGSGLFYYFTTSGGSPAMAASKVDIFTPNGAGKVLPGAPIQYRTLIANTGGGDATAVDFADAIPANTTLVPGSVNVSPLAEDNVYSTIVNTQLAAGSPTVLSGPLVTSAVKVTDNDREFLTDTFTISTFDGTSAAGGSVVMVTSGGNAGSFTYVPPAGFVGVDSFTYTLRDDGTDSTAGNADDLTGIGTVVINVSEADTVASGTQKVWYIDNSYAGANGTENGTSARPFNDLSDVTGATGPDIAGDTLHLALGADYAGGITFLADQTLVGEGVALVLNGITLAPLNDKAVITNGSGAGITLATNNTIRGVEVRNTSTVDILGTAVGNLTISATSCTGTGGILTVSTSGALNVSLDEATTTASGTTGIDINTCTGTLTVASGTLAGITSTDVNINAGTVAVSIAASINNTSGRPVLIQNHAIGAITLSGNIGSSVSGTGILVQNNISGTITFSGSSQVINTGNNSAVSLTSNSGATVSFTGGGLDIDTTSAAAFTATGGGTVNVTGANNTLTTTTAAALNVTNTTIGASGLTFRSISSSGGTSNGIILDTTGTSGGLTVTGDGTNTSPGGNSSGGTIANKSGADGNTTQGIGIYLNNTRDVVLRRMTISGVNQNFGIRGFGVTNFTLQYCTVGSPTPTNSGSIAANLQGTNNSSIGEGAIYFGSQTDGILGLTGTASIDNCFISAGRTDNMQLSNGGGTLNRLVITNSTFGYNFTGTPAANAALTVVARRASSGNTLLNSTVTGCTFVGTPGNAANFTGQEPTTTLGIAMDTIFQNNTITNDHLQNFLGGSNITIAGFSSTTFNISNNSLRDANGSAITLQMGAPGAGSTVATALSGTIHNNTIGVNGVPDSGSVSGNGIFFSFADNTTAPKGQVNLAVTNNIVRNYSGNAGI